MSDEKKYRRRPCRLFSALSQLAGPLVMVIAMSATGVFGAAGLQSAAAAAFDAYIRKTEARMSGELKNAPDFLWIEDLPSEQRSKTYEELRTGRVAVENARGTNSSSAPSVPGGLIHHWKAVVFVPGVSLDQAIALLQDYDHDNDYFSPDVIRSKLLSRDGENFSVYLRLKRKYVVTTVFDTEYEVRYTKLNATRAYSESRSTKIQEVQNAGQSNEKIISTEEDHGFLWRLNSYWRFEQANGGVFIQCEAISLSRDVPQGMGWAVKPFIEQIPQESLRVTLQATRAALLKKYAPTSDAHASSERRARSSAGPLRAPRKFTADSPKGAKVSSTKLCQDTTFYPERSRRAAVPEGLQYSFGFSG
jgi:hypothetical protein